MTMAEHTEDVPKLFQPVKVGDITLGHRVVMAPLTRHRADKDYVHTDLAVTYYAQRASVPGTLLITEATFIAPFAGLFDQVPGIWNDAQIAAWKKVSGVDSSPLRWMSMFMVSLPAYSDLRGRPRQGVVHLPPAVGHGPRGAL